ncbi:MAG: hypothetical protein KAJ19_24425, partial [Gammaproteobacteria bacterium]|nr:hypothetical protein [Gammaproteobacteria bacterium]
DKGFAFDTRLAQQLLASDLPSDLDFLRGHYTSIPPYKPPKAEMKKMLSWPKEKLLRYACLDAVTTKIVMHEQEKKLTEGQITLMQELLIPLVRVVNKMMHAGVLVDVNALAGLYMQCAPRTDEINGVFEKEGVNPRSSKQMAKFYDLKNTQKETLRAQIVRKHPKWELMELHLEYRALYKMQSQYLRGIYKRLDNGRIHTTFKIEGTGTGRLTSEDPNLNNVPAQMKVIYIPDPGHCFVVGDYSQIELWVMALIAEEELMLKELQDGVDIHYAMCQLCFPNVPLKHGKRKLDFDYHQDFAAKSVTFGTAYGRTPWSIAREFGVSVATAEDWQLKCIHRYPKLGVYKQRCEDAFKRKGSLTTPFGRVRQLASVKQGYNFPIQSTAADIIFQSLIMADAEGLSPRLSVYDDAVFQVNLKTFDEEFKKIQTVMEHPVPQLGGVQIPIKYTRGINWYEQEAIDV